MLYNSKKKKIREWKRHIKKIERWKQNVIDLDSDYFSDYQRTCAKLWIHPFFTLIRRNPPLCTIDLYLGNKIRC